MKLRLIMIFLIAKLMFASDYNSSYTHKLKNLIYASCCDCKDYDCLHKIVFAKKIKYLINHGADPNVLSKNNIVAIHVATKMGDYNICKFLWANNSDINISDHKVGSVLHYACKYGHIDIVEWLINHGADINHQAKFPGSDWEYPILMSVANNDIAITKMLIDHKADVNVMDRWHNSPLYIAAHRGNFDMLNLLIDNNADTYLFFDYLWNCSSDVNMVINFLFIIGDPSKITRIQILNSMFPYPKNFKIQKKYHERVDILIKKRFLIIFKHIPQINELPKELIEQIMTYIMRPWIIYQ